MTYPQAERLFAYHDATKHTQHSVYRSGHTLDWVNMPDPFRHYEGVPVLDLPAEPPPPAIPALSVLHGKPGAGDTRSAAHWLSQLFYYSAAISASKKAPSGYRYALRVNPSSGNLHPTEFHFRTRALADWPDGCYHYRPSSHMAEQRATGSAGPDGPITILLTSLAWREAWKYRSRAYRYCLLDIGHAWQSLALAARSMGLEARALGHFCDSDVSRAWGLADEWPMLLMQLSGNALPLGASAETAPPHWIGGTPNPLSAVQIPYPLIDEIHAATSLPPHIGPIAAVEPPPRGQGSIQLGPQDSSSEPFGLVARRRRSALDFRGGARHITFAQFSTLLHAAQQPLQADFTGGLVQLYLYVHRVEDVAPGVYRYWAGDHSLELIRSGDQRLMAAALSLAQDLAGNACVAFSMIADLERATRAWGDRAYRYVHFEAGAIGQRLYLAAEAMGFQSTGIGAFFDDEVHRYLGIPPEQGQVVYHFSTGFAVADDRLGA